MQQPSIAKIIQAIAAILLVAGLLLFVFCGHELIRRTGPGNMGGNSIRYLLLLITLAADLPVMIVCILRLAAPKLLTVCLVVVILSLEYTVLCYFNNRTFYADQLRYLMEHAYPDELPPPVRNYLIMAAAHILLLPVLYGKLRRLKKNRQA
jgi:hypothetical protein